MVGSNGSVRIIFSNTYTGYYWLPILLLVLLVTYCLYWLLMVGKHIAAVIPRMFLGAGVLVRYIDPSAKKSRAYLGLNQTVGGHWNQQISDANLSSYISYIAKIQAIKVGETAGNPRLYQNGIGEDANQHPGGFCSFLEPAASV